MIHFQLRWQKRGIHIYARLFSFSENNLTGAKNGNLCFRPTEWEAFLRCFDSKGVDQVVVVPDETPAPGA